MTANKYIVIKIEDAERALNIKCQNELQDLAEVVTAYRQRAGLQPLKVLVTEKDGNANKEQAASGGEVHEQQWTIGESDLLHLLSVKIGAAYTSVSDAIARSGIKASQVSPSPTASAAQQGRADGTLIERLDYEVSTGNLTHSENRALLQEARDALARQPAKWEWFMDESYYGMACVRKAGDKEFGQGFHLNSVAEAEALCTLLNSAAPAPQQGERVAEWLSKDDAEVALHAAIKRIKIGLPTDDKLILAELRKVGVYLATWATDCECPSCGKPAKTYEVDGETHVICECFED